MVVLGGGAVSYERGTPVVPTAGALRQERRVVLAEWGGSEAGSYLRLIDFCVTQL